MERKILMPKRAVYTQQAASDSNHTWNLTTELMRREYGISDRLISHAYKSIQFNTGLPGSSYIADKMQLTHITGTLYNSAVCVDFNNKGDLLCIAYSNRHIAVYDWAQDQVKCDFLAEKSIFPAAVKFLNSRDNNLDIISTYDNGQIFRSVIDPAGQATTTLLYKAVCSNPSGPLGPRTVAGVVGPAVAEVPRSVGELVVATIDGRLFIIDLRCNQKDNSPRARMRQKYAQYSTFTDVAHHPFVPEICAVGAGGPVRIFDKRNLSKSLREMSTSFSISYTGNDCCSYNIDGSQILVSYSDRDSALFKNRAKKRVSEPKFPKYAKFFGSISDNIVTITEEDIYFYHKNSTTGWFTSKHWDPFKLKVEPCTLKTHRFLPIIACVEIKSGVAVFSTMRKTFDEKELETRYTKCCEFC